MLILHLGRALPSTPSKSIVLSSVRRMNNSWYVYWLHNWMHLRVTNKRYKQLLLVFHPLTKTVIWTGKFSNGLPRLAECISLLIMKPWVPFTADLAYRAIRGIFHLPAFYSLHIQVLRSFTAYSLLFITKQSFSSLKLVLRVRTGPKTSPRYQIPLGVGNASKHTEKAMYCLNLLNQWSLYPGSSSIAVLCHFV